jgi:hypothetical protein
MDPMRGWSARMMNYDTGNTNQVGFYAYHTEQPDDCGEHLMWNQQLQRDRWYAIEARIKLNTVTVSTGNRDGILEGWIDGVKVFSRTNLRFRHTTALKVERIWGNIYVGGSWTAPTHMNIHFDNFVVARNPIGPFSTTGGGSGSPCDLNGDNATNVSDVQQCVNQAIGSAACSSGDINQDNLCNVVDVQRVVNAALGNVCSTQ